MNITEALGQFPAGAGVLATFALMDEAEKLLARHSKPFGSRIFLALCPPPGMSTFRPEVYRAHAAELIARAKDRLRPSLEPGTEAECLLALHAASLEHPPKAVYADLMEALFARVLPPAEYARLGMPKARDGMAMGMAMAAALAELRQMTRVPGRALKPRGAS